MTDHAIQRAMERYGVELTRTDIRTMEEAIKDSRSIVVHSHNGGQVHMINHQGVVFLGVPGNVGHIVTFLPPEALNAEHNRTRRKEKYAGGRQRRKGKRRGFF